MEVIRIGEFVFLKDEKGEVVAKILLMTDIDGRKGLLIKHPAGLSIHIYDFSNTEFQTSCKEFLAKYSTTTVKKTE